MTTAETTTLAVGRSSWITWAVPRPRRSCGTRRSRTPRRAHLGATGERLARMSAEYDPRNLFGRNLDIAPAG